jgi:hypothetical protein
MNLRVQSSLFTTGFVPLSQDMDPLLYFNAHTHTCRRDALLVTPLRAKDARVQLRGPGWPLLLRPVVPVLVCRTRYSSGRLPIRAGAWCRTSNTPPPLRAWIIPKTGAGELLPEGLQILATSQRRWNVRPLNKALVNKTRTFLNLTPLKDTFRLAAETESRHGEHPRLS